MLYSWAARRPPSNSSDSIPTNRSRAAQPPPMADPNLSVSLSTLICDEDVARLDHETDQDDDENEEEEANGTNIADDEYVETLLSKESCSFDGKSPEESSFEESLKPFRSDSIRWIINARKSLRFSWKTAYMAVVYFDQFFKHRTIDIVEHKAWAVKLLAMACASLAVKMEERVAPPLSEFQVRECRFSCEAIRRMELLLLSTLDWKMSPVTPFNYLSYLASKLGGGGGESKVLVFNAIKFIFSILEVMNLTDHRPSVVAAAAVLAAKDDGLDQERLESKMSIISSYGSFEIREQVFACYKLMIQESQKEKPKAKSDLASSSNGGSIKSSNDAANGTISFALESSSKRRRLQ